MELFENIKHGFYPTWSQIPSDVGGSLVVGM